MVIVAPIKRYRMRTPNLMIAWCFALSLLNFPLAKTMKLITRITYTKIVAITLATNQHTMIQIPPELLVLSVASIIERIKTTIATRVIKMSISNTIMSSTPTTMKKILYFLSH